jgi:hypothetical protein
VPVVRSTVNEFSEPKVTCDYAVDEEGAAVVGREGSSITRWIFVAQF